MSRARLADLRHAYPAATKHLWPQVNEAFRAVDLIMYGGDLMMTEVLDWLEEIAPVLAVEGNGDYTGFERSVGPPDPRLSEAKVLSLNVEDGPLRIGRSGSSLGCATSTTNGQMEN